MTYFIILLNSQIWILIIMKLKILLLIFMIYIILKFNYFYIISWTSHFLFHYFSYSIYSKNFFYLQWFFISFYNKNYQVLFNFHSSRKIPQNSCYYYKIITNHYKINIILEEYDIFLKICKYSSSWYLQRLLSKIPWIRYFINFRNFCKWIYKLNEYYNSLVSRFFLTWFNHLYI